MNSKEQFLKTINHQQPDRVVIDFGSTPVTGIHVHALSRLRRHYGLQRKPIRVIEPFQMLGEVGWELIDSVGIDVVGAWGKNNIFGFSNHGPFKEWKTPWGQRVMVPMNFNVTRANGNVLIHPEGDVSFPPSAQMPENGYFFEPANKDEPLGEEELNIDYNLEEFGLISEKEIEHWRVEIDKAYFSGKAVMVTFDGTALGDIAYLPGMKLQHPKGIRDISEWYNAINNQPKIIKKIFEKQTEIAIENMRRIYDVVGNKINVVYLCGTNFVTADSDFCEVEQFMKLWMPSYKKMNDWIHQNTQWKSFKHSGATDAFFESFIHAGFDIISPVDLNIPGISARKIKEKFGRDLVFWGGGVDSQKTMAEGTPQEVRKEVIQNCGIFIKNGGFVFSTIHNIQANTPVENIVAMFEAIREFNGK